MAFESKNLATKAAGALFIALVAVILYFSFESESDSSAANPAGAAASGPGTAESTPLPGNVQTLDSLIDYARQQAVEWRKDARLTRLYADPVRVDGKLDRAGAVIQVVFVSPEATQERQEANGWRLSVRGGAFEGMPIWQHPPPELDDRRGGFCPLAPIVGDGAPDEFTLDVHYARRAGREPSLLAFTKTPKRWLVRADPFTCKVRERSTERTDEEILALNNQADASGPLFDAHAATKMVSRAIGASNCRKQGAGWATVQVTFDKAGTVKAVAFIAGEVGAMDAGRCLEKALMKLRLPPWERGDGRAAARFVW